MPELPDLDARIVTNRLELLPLVQAHAEQLFSILSDVSLYEHTHETPPPTLEVLRARYARLRSRRSPDGNQVWLNWLLQRAGSDEAIGYVQATIFSGEAKVAWVVGIPWQGRGYATEAARAMVAWLQSAGVDVTRATISPLHTASQRVAAKAGFRPTDQVVDGEDVWVLLRASSRSG